MQEGFCDFCHKSVKIRLNDTVEVLLKRLQNYRSFLEKVVESAKQTFPYVVFNTEYPLKKCLQNYDHFMKNLLQFSGTIRQLEKEFSPQIASNSMEHD